MRVFEFWNLGSRIIFLILFLPLFCLSFFSYFFYKLLVLLVCLFIVSELVNGIKLSRGRSRGILSTLILLVALWAGYYISPEFNFLLTSSIRQSVAEKIISNSFIPAPPKQEVELKNDNFTENLLLGQVTAYVSQNHNSVYFTYHKSLTQAAFFVYTSNPKSIDTRYHQLKQLKTGWFFLLRGYA